MASQTTPASTVYVLRGTGATVQAFPSALHPRPAVQQTLGGGGHTPAARDAHVRRPSRRTSPRTGRRRPALREHEDALLVLHLL